MSCMPSMAPRCSMMTTSSGCPHVVYGDRGHGRLSRSGDALYDQVHFRRSPDDGILFLLDRGNDLPEDRTFIAGKIFCQELVVCHYVRVEEIDQAVVCDLVGPFAFQVDLAVPFILDCIAAVSDRVLVVNGRNRCAPVYDHGFGTAVGDTDPSYIVGLSIGDLRVLEVNAAEIRLQPRLPAAEQVPLILSEPGLRVVEESERLLVLRAIGVHQLVQLV